MSEAIARGRRSRALHNDMLEKELFALGRATVDIEYKVVFEELDTERVRISYSHDKTLMYVSHTRNHQHSKSVINKALLCPILSLSLRHANGSAMEITYWVSQGSLRLISFNRTRSEVSRVIHELTLEAATTPPCLPPLWYPSSRTPVCFEGLEAFSDWVSMKLQEAKGITRVLPDYDGVTLPFEYAYSGLYEFGCTPGGAVRIHAISTFYYGHIWNDRFIVLAESVSGDKLLLSLTGTNGELFSFPALSASLEGRSMGFLEGIAELYMQSMI